MYIFLLQSQGETLHTWPCTGKWQLQEKAFSFSVLVNVDYFVIVVWLYQAHFDVKSTKHESLCIQQCGHNLGRLEIKIRSP